MGYRNPENILRRWTECSNPGAFFYWFLGFDRHFRWKEGSIVWHTTCILKCLSNHLIKKEKKSDEKSALLRCALSFYTRIKLFGITQIVYEFSVYRSASEIVQYLVPSIKNADRAVSALRHWGRVLENSPNIKNQNMKINDWPKGPYLLMTPF